MDPVHRDDQSSEQGDAGGQPTPRRPLDSRARLRREALARPRRESRPDSSREELFDLQVTPTDRLRIWRLTPR